MIKQNVIPVAFPSSYIDLSPEEQWAIAAKIMEKDRLHADEQFFLEAKSPDFAKRVEAIASVGGIVIAASNLQKVIHRPEYLSLHNVIRVNGTFIWTPEGFGRLIRPETPAIPLKVVEVVFSDDPQGISESDQDEIVYEEVSYWKMASLGACTLGWRDDGIAGLLELLPKADGIVIAHPGLKDEFRRPAFSEVTAMLRQCGTKILTPDGPVSV